MTRKRRPLIDILRRCYGEYDPEANAKGCYDLAIATMREKLESFRCERIGPHKLYLGDCRELLPLLPKVDAVVTDPPYGIARFQKPNSIIYANMRERDVGLKWDIRPTDEFISEVIRSGAHAIVWGGNYFSLPGTRAPLVWDKNAGAGLSFADFEMAWTNIDMVARRIALRPMNMDGGKEHPTQKPLAVMQWCLGFLPDAKTILDPFMGSGTTGVACQKLGRRFIGIELDPGYFETACKRVSDAMSQPDMFVTPPEPAPEQLTLPE